MIFRLIIAVRWQFYASLPLKYSCFCSQSSFSRYFSHTKGGHWSPETRQTAPESQQPPPGLRSEENHHHRPTTGDSKENLPHHPQINNHHHHHNNNHHDDQSTSATEEGHPKSPQAISSHPEALRPHQEVTKTYPQALHPDEARGSQQTAPTASAGHPRGQHHTEGSHQAERGRAQWDFYSVLFHIQQLV